MAVSKSILALGATIVLLASPLAFPMGQADSPRVRAAVAAPGLVEWLDATPGGAKAEVIVQFHADAVDAEHVGLLARHGMAPLLVYDAIAAVYTAATPAQVAALSLDARVKYVEPNRPITFHLDHSVAEIGARAGGRTPGAWEDLGITGDGVTVAVVDTGIDATHADLPYGSKVVMNVKVAQAQLGGPIDDVPVIAGDLTSGHGTHVAGTVAGTGAASAGLHKGVAPGARLIGVGVGEGVSMAFGTAGLNWAWRNVEQYGIDVVSNSWGISGGSNYNANGAVEQVIKKLYDKGVVVTFAVGNDGTDANGNPQWGTDRLNGYAMSPYAMGVAAYNDYGGLISDFSSRGNPTKADLTKKTGQERRPDVAAPGENVLAAAALTGGAASIVPRVPGVSDYVLMSGTSMATPHASGVAALVIEALEDRGCTSWTPEHVWSAIYRTARKNYLQTSAGNGGSAFDSGHGAIDAYAAVKLAKTAPACNTITGALPGNFPSDPAKVWGDTILYTGGRVSPFVFTDLFLQGTTVVASGEPVSIRVRSAHSLDAAFPVDAQTRGVFELARAGAPSTILATFPVTVGSAETSPPGTYSLGTDVFDLPNLAPGEYVLRAWLNTGSGAYVPTPLHFKVIG